MKRIVLALFACTALIASCKKDEAPKPAPKPDPVLPGSKSYIKISYKDKNFEARDTIYAIPAAARQLYPILMRFNSVKSDLYPNAYDKNFAINTFSGDKFSNGDIQIVVGGISYAIPGANDYVGTYKTTFNNSPDAWYVEETKSKDRYRILKESVIIIKHNDDEYTEGSMKLNLEGNIDAKAEFKIYKKL
ncbi:MAG TPA: hypothetical protein VL092_13605 [Chitinophagaceae bacterium]|nr:hypothetical protein [Chitinophagaceae bacterium]